MSMSYKRVIVYTLHLSGDVLYHFIMATGVCVTRSFETLRHTKIPITTPFSYECSELLALIVQWNGMIPINSVSVFLCLVVLDILAGKEKGSDVSLVCIVYSNVVINSLADFPIFLWCNNNCCAPFDRGSYWYRCDYSSVYIIF